MTRAGSLRARFPLGKRPPRIYLHIGAMKTGTTYLQHLMEANKAALADAGYLFPGETWRDQVRAARDVLGFGRDPELREDLAGAWDDIVAQMLEHRGTASIFSMEYLSYSSAKRAARIVESLSGAEVHVILCVRDAATALPAQWQTSCRNAGTLPWPRLVAALRRAVTDDRPPRRPAARMFQRTQGTVRMLDVWVPLVGSRRVHVITVPPRGSDPRLLWQRFASVVGLDPAVAGLEPERSNVSPFGYPTTEFLRRLNVELSDHRRTEAERTVLELMRNGLQEHARQEPPVLLHRRGLAAAARWNRRVRAAIKDQGVQMVGELSDLPVRRPDPSAPEALPEATPAQILASAAVAKEVLTGLEEQLRTRLGDRAGPAGPPVRGTDGGLADTDPEGQAVRDVADLVRRCARLEETVGGAGSPDVLTPATAGRLPG